MKSHSPFVISLTLLAICPVTAPFAANVSTAGEGAIKSAATEKTPPELPKAKRTSLGLYVTAKEAYEMWQANPAELKIIDVRTPEEYLFVGHPAMAWNVPFAVQTWKWDAKKERFPMKPLPDFVARVKQIAGPGDTLLLMCRSGGRSALAVNMLAEAGFRSVYNTTDGMEGDAVDDDSSVFHGKRMKNGWKNSAPWTYTVDPEKLILKEGVAKQNAP